MTIKQYMTFMGDKDRENSLLSRSLESFLKLIEPYEVDFKSIVPIMGLERYCQLYKHYLSFFVGAIRFKYHVFSNGIGKSTKPYVAIHPILENGATIGSPVLLQITEENFKLLLKNDTTQYVKYYHKKIAIVRNFMHENNKALVYVVIQNNRTKVCYKNYHKVIKLDRNVIRDTDTKTLKTDFINMVRQKGFKSEIYKAVKPRKIK